MTHPSLDDPIARPGSDRLTSYARRVLELAEEEARSFNHDYVGSEHLLLGLVSEEDGVAGRVLSNVGIKLQRVRAAVEFLVGRGERPPGGEITATPGLLRALELALDEGKRQGHHYVGTEHLILGLARQGGGIAGYVLEYLGLSLESVRTEVIRVIIESSAYVPPASASGTGDRAALGDTSPRTAQQGALRVFYSYSHRDETSLERLRRSLSLLKREALIEEWHDRKIGAGREWEGEIDAYLEAADIILLLVSPDFIASDYCWDVEVRRAMEKHEAGQARVIPVILRPAEWHAAPFGKLQALPRDGRPVTKWGNRDEAWLNVARGIRAAVRDLAGRG